MKELPRHIISKNSLHYEFIDRFVSNVKKQCLQIIFVKFNTLHARHAARYFFHVKCMQIKFECDMVAIDHQRDDKDGGCTK